MIIFPVHGQDEHGPVTFTLSAYGYVHRYDSQGEHVLTVKQWIQLIRSYAPSRA